jgi:hypothetical protein
VKVLARVRALPSAAALESLQALQVTSDPASPAAASSTAEPMAEPTADTTPGGAPLEVAASAASATSKPLDLFAVGKAAGEQPWDVIVAVRSGNLIATAFHPEFTSDLRWHEYFIGIVRSARESH